MKAQSFLSVILLIFGSNSSFADDTNVPTIKPLRTMGSVHFKHDHCVWGLACSPKGDYLASSGADGVIRLWETKNFDLVWEMGSNHLSLRELAFSPDGKFLAVSNPSEPFSIIEVTTGKQIPFFDDPLIQRGLTSAISPDGKWIAFVEELFGVPAMDWRISVWDFARRKQIYTFTGHSPKDPKWSLAFSPDSNYLVSGCDDEKILFWNLKTGKKEYQIDSKSSLRKILFSPQGNLLATVDEEGIQIRHPRSGKVLRTLEYSKRSSFANSAFSPDETLLATRGEITTHIILRNVETGKIVQTLQGHLKACEALAFAPDGKMLYSGAEDGTIRIWDTKSGKELFAKEDHIGAVNACTFSPNGDFFLSGGEDGIIRKWDTQTGKLFDRFSLGGVTPSEITRLTTTNEYFAVSTSEFGEGYISSIRFCNPKTKQISLLFREKGVGVRSLHLREEGKNASLFAFLSNGELLTWSPDFISTKLVMRKLPPEGRTIDVNWNEKKVSGLYGEKSDIVLVSHLEPKKEVRYSFESEIFRAILSPNERYLLTHHGLGGTIFSTTNPLRKMKTLAPSPRRSNPHGFSPDSRYLVMNWSQPRISSIYETATRNKILDLDGHRAEITSIAFSPDSRFLLTGSEDSRLMLWDLRSFGKPEAKLMNATEKELTSWWSDLQNDNPQIGLQAVSRLVRFPIPSVAYLKNHLRAIDPIPEAKVNQLLRELDDASFATRKKAFTQLDDKSELIEERLQKELKNSPSSEVQNAITKIIENLDQSRTIPNGSALRQIRAVQVLEYIGSEEAKEVLKGLAKGATKALLTQEAQEALGRLERQRKN